MNKSQIREINRLAAYRAAGADTGMLARSVSALIRACLTERSRVALIETAQEWGLTKHPEFLI
jgi:hypothetical protein